MRRILIAFAVLLCFAANQTAMAFEQCEDMSCVSGTMDAQKQAEHQKKDPACAGHCSVSSHHAFALPMQAITSPVNIAEVSTSWGLAFIPESFSPEGLIEPPSLA